MKLNYLIIYVDNAVKATEFYKKAFEKAISNGAKKIKEPEKKPWGQVVAHVQDSFGTIVKICTPMG